MVDTVDTMRIIWESRKMSRRCLFCCCFVSHKIHPMENVVEVRQNKYALNHGYVSNEPEVITVLLSYLLTARVSIHGDRIGIVCGYVCLCICLRHPDGRAVWHTDTMDRHNDGAQFIPVGLSVWRTVKRMTKEVYVSDVFFFNISFLCVCLCSTLEMSKRHL